MKKIFLFLLIFIITLSAAAESNYKVRQGDTLYNIAVTQLGSGSRWQEIAVLNNIAEPYLIREGQTIILPDSAGKENAVPAANEPLALPLNISVLETGNLYIPQDTANIMQDREEKEINSEVVSFEVVSFENRIPKNIAAVIPQSMIPQITLREEYRSLTLEQAVQIGLANAPEVRAAVSNIEKVKGMSGQVWSNALPQLNTSAGIKQFETYKSQSAFSSIDAAVTSADATLTQAVWSFGRISHALKAAKAEEAAAVSRLADAKLGVRFRIESAYLNLLFAKENMNSAKEALLVSERLLARARIREEAGAGTRFDVTRAEAEAANAQSKVIAAEAEVQAGKEELAVSMGIDASNSPDAGELLMVDLATITPVSADDAINIALEERPDLIVLKKQIESSEELTLYEKAKGLPSINAMGNISYSYYDYNSQSIFYTGKENSSGFIGVTMSVPIFDGFRVRESVRAQRATTEELRAQFDRARLEAVKNVRRIYLALGAAMQSIAAHSEEVRSAREALRMAEVSFDAGRATTLDVIQASLVLTNARTAEAGAYHQFRIGLAQLIKAAGTDIVIKGGR